MPIYRERRMISLITWNDFEKFVEEYGLSVIFGDMDISPLDQEFAYTLLQERFSYSTFRYTDVVAVGLAMRRTSRHAVRELVEKKKLYEDMYLTTIEDLRSQRQTVINTVQKPNIMPPNFKADKVPISNLSSEQETTTQLTGKIDELVDKWRILTRNVYEKFYEEYVELFSVVIVDSDDILVYPQED